MKTISRTAATILFFLPIGYAKAGTNGVAVGVSANSVFTDNALKRSDNLLSERQDTYALNTAANYNNDWMALTSGYNLNETVYSEKSQANLNTLEGKAAINIGNSYYPESLLVSHSRHSLLNAPDAVDISTNRDERNILLVEPGYKLRLGAADSVQAALTYSDVAYRRNAAKNVTTQGGEINWLRNISKVDSFQLTGQSTQSSYSQSSVANYHYESLLAKYAVALNHFSYSVGIGSNRATQEALNKTVTSPNYDVAAVYDSGLNVIRISFSEKITDSSTGNGNSESISSSGPDSTTTNSTADLINSRSYDAALTTRAICERCDFSVTGSNRLQDYQTLPEDMATKSASVSFAYKLTRAASIDLTRLRTSTTFSNSAIARNYIANSAKITFNYRLINQISLQVYTGKEQRISEILTQSFNEKTVGLSASYQF